jgi:quinol---cytochrome c reductase cytochrome c subunit, bacillus type
MKNRDKEQYLQEYEVLKKKGKPFFPYAVLKDATMMLVVAIVVVVLSIVMGADQGPKVDPTTTTYVPRPDWYFYFLFELLRVFRDHPIFTPLATVIIPTIAMVMLILLPFYDRGPERRPERRPIATIAGVLTIVTIAYLTLAGADTGSPNEVALATPKQYDAGKEVVAQSGCGACHLIGENGNNGPGPELTHIGARIPRAAILRSLEIGPGIMPAYKDLSQKKLDDLADFLSAQD